jgi:tripartite-type tricarboxylate transporter receptor subunit TctC
MSFFKPIINTFFKGENRMKKIMLLAACLLLAVGFFAFAGGGKESADPAAGFPKSQITITCPPAPGGGTDLLLRAMAPVMRNVLGQPVIVVNKPGAAMAIGFNAAKQDTPDGYNIVAIVPELLAVPQVTKVDYSYKDFEIICLFNTSYGTLSVQKDAPYNTVAEFVAYAKQNPGKIRFGNSGIGGNWHVLAAAFAQKAGIDVIHVPFDGGGPAAIAVAGGHVEATTCSAQEVDGQVQAGKIKILCNFSPKRLDAFPTIPTGVESGYPEPILTIFRGFGAPKGTPPEIIKILSEATRKTLEDPEIIKFCETQHFSRDYLNAEDFTKLVLQEEAISTEQSEALG